MQFQGLWEPLMGRRTLGSSVSSSLPLNRLPASGADSGRSGTPQLPSRRADAGLAGAWHSIRIASPPFRPWWFEARKQNQIGKEAVVSQQEMNTLLRRLVAGAVALILLLLVG